MATKRQQIIDLINEYIYTNGKQRITAVQLNEILTLIANSFELTGQGTGGGGINDVLNTDRTVENNQSILNKNGGRLELSGILPVTDAVAIPYIGFTTIREGNEEGEPFRAGTAISNELNTYIGHASGFNPFENGLINRPKDTEGTQNKGKDIPTHALSLYVSNNINLGDNGLKRGVYSGLLQEDVSNSIAIQEDRIEIKTESDYIDAVGVKVNLENMINVGLRSIDQEILSEGKVGARETLNLERKLFDFYDETTLEIDGRGLKMKPAKRLSYDADPYSGTAGVAKLQEGEAYVETGAINEHSYVMLTVQSGGEFNGNIRVAEISTGSGFLLYSSDRSDNCTVLWQIIDINDEHI